MSGPKCAFNTAAALRRVFIPTNLGTSEYLHVTRIFVPALLVLPINQARAYSWASRTSNSTAPRRRTSFLDDTRDNFAYPRGESRKYPPRDDNRPGPRVTTKLARLQRDDEIRAPLVYIEEPTEDGKGRLVGPRRTSEALAELDRKTYSLQVIESQNPDDPEAPKWPICRVVNKLNELAQQKREKEQKKKAAAQKGKSLELNWALAPHDLDHKLRTMQKFLARGYKVEVLLLQKQKGRAKATEQDANAIVDKIVEATREVTGSKEWKGREGKLLGSLKIFLQGKLQQAKESVEESVEDSEAEKET